MFDGVCRRFGLGMAVTQGRRVAGEHHNEVWRLDTVTGAYAVKRLSPLTDVDQLEAAVVIERAARDAGVPMPEPLKEPDTGLHLARIDGVVVRVHRWMDGRPPSMGDLTPSLARQAGSLLATVHTAGAFGAAPTADTSEPAVPGFLADLREATRRPGAVGTAVASHGDLHPKNALLRPTGELAFIDWDTARTYVAEQEAVGLAIDWSAGVDGSIDPERFDAAVEGYRTAGGVAIPAAPWVFGGWVLGYLGYVGRIPSEGILSEGQRETEGVLARLREVAGSLESLVSRLQ